MRSFNIRLAIVGILGSLAACGGGGGGDSGSGGDGEVLGDFEGDGGGGLIVVGDSSTTLFADSQGRFNLGRLARGTRVRSLVPGYFSRSLQVSGSSIHFPLEEDPEPEKAPTVVIESLTPVPQGLRVRAQITPSTGAGIVDARAEVLGTDDGVVLTASAGGSYSGTIRMSNPSRATVMVFAVDDAGRHGEQVEDTEGEPDPGSWTGQAEHWVGSFFGQHRGGYNFGHYSFNASLTIALDGTTTGLAAQVRLWRLESHLDPIVLETLTGTARVIGQNYKVELSGMEHDVSMTLMGSVSDDDGYYTGFADGTISGLPYHARFVLTNTYVYPNPWSAQALVASWGLSFHYKNQPLTPSTYQSNVQCDVDGAGQVIAGKITTLGPLTSGGSLSFLNFGEENLGYFTGTLGLDDGTTYTLYAFMGVGLRRVRGVWSSTASAYGAFWGRRDATWLPEDFDAQWQGEFVVTSGPDAGLTLNAQVTLNSNGQVTGAGSIVGATGGTIVIQSGSLSFVDGSVGGVIGEFTGDQQGSFVSVNMSAVSAPETASMGVFHGRLIGKFGISTNGDGGYYFLYRNSHD